MVLFRSAVKQICRRHGYHATFMCRPAFENAMSSGWHLHQSLADAAGRNLFAPEDPAKLLSTLGRHYLAGLFEGACEAVAFTTPTINGYKRYRALSLAPDRVAWGADNRGRDVASRGRIQSPLRLASRTASASRPRIPISIWLHSSQRDWQVSRRAKNRHRLPTHRTKPSAQMLPTSLGAALDVLTSGHLLREAFGQDFIDYYALIKRAEVRRYETAVTDWEMQEYFDIF